MDGEAIDGRIDRPTHDLTAGNQDGRGRPDQAPRAAAPGELPPSPVDVPAGQVTRVAVDGMTEAGEALSAEASRFTIEAELIASGFPVLTRYGTPKLAPGVSGPAMPRTVAITSFGNSYDSQESVLKLVAAHQTAMDSNLALLAAVRTELTALSNAVGHITVQFGDADTANAAGLERVREATGLSEPGKENS